MATRFNPRIFREYDIRGVADRDLDDLLARDLGEVFAMRVGDALGRGKTPTIVVGRDCRLHSHRLFQALQAGLRGTATVIDVGVVATPELYFASHHLRADGAIMITGSHNPAEDNGFKLLIGGASQHGAAITALRDGIAALRGGATLAPPMGAMRGEDTREAYLAHALGQLRLGPRRMRVVVDAGNGAGGPAAVALYQRAGFDVVPLFCEPDGRFPNHHPDPTVPANLAALIAKVAETDAELGIALDGDADRVGVVDRTGRILWGDELMILLGRAVLAEVPGATFVGEVKCSQAMFDQLRAAGGHAEMWKVGHSLIKARMKALGAQLAGEMSGHLFFAHRYLGFDDGIYAGARVLELLSRSEATLAELAAALPQMVNTPEIRRDCPDDVKFAVVADVTARLRAHPDVTDVVDIDGVRASFDGGWMLVRASNTQASLVLRAEARDAARLEELRALLEREVAAAIASATAGRSGAA
jgi:phosphomannomutase/phosphoglucomutase